MKEDGTYGDGRTDDGRRRDGRRDTTTAPTGYDGSDGQMTDDGDDGTDTTVGRTTTAERTMRIGQTFQI